MQIEKLCDFKKSSRPVWIHIFIHYYQLGGALVYIWIGENETGKTTLIAKMQGVDEPKKGSGLEYMYVDVKDEDRDGKLLHIFLNPNFLYHNNHDV